MKKLLCLIMAFIAIMALAGCNGLSSYAAPKDALAANIVEQENKALPDHRKTEPSLSTPIIYIYHTHTSEAYADTGSVVDVGEELVTCLREKYNLNVIHDTAIYDHDLLNSYEKSFEGINSFISQGQVPDFFIDIHRDASTTASAILAQGKKTAKIDLIVGKGEGFEKDERPDFHENHQFANQLYIFLNESEPEIVNQIKVKDYGRYNQHLGTSVLLSIGNDCDIYEDAIATVPYIADAIAEIITSRS